MKNDGEGGSVKKAFDNSIGLLVRLAFVASAFVDVARAQDDEEGLPDEPSTDEQALEDDEDSAADAPLPADPEGSGDQGAPKAAAGEDEASGPTWESYNSEMSESVAQEVTKGVRVEDIVEPPTDYRYAAFGKADPFVPPVVTRDGRVSTTPGVDPLEIPIVSPLQRFNLADLAVVGVWQLATGERKAMIMARSDGGAAQGIIVKNGDPVGNRGGKILGISDSYVTVREFTLAPDGTRQYEDQQLFMSGAGEDPTGRIRFTPGEKTTELLIDGGLGQQADGALQKFNSLQGDAKAAAGQGAGGTPTVVPPQASAPAAAARPQDAASGAAGAPGQPAAAAPQPFVNPLLPPPAPAATAAPGGDPAAPAAVNPGGATVPASSVAIPAAGGINQIQQPPGSL